MDVELQILKHLARDAQPTVTFIDKYCLGYKNLFPEVRRIREIIFGKRSYRSYWEITLEPETLPKNSTVFVMTNLQGDIKKILGNLYGLRTWIEYAFRQDKQELGWKDYRFTNFQNIEKWWKIIFSVYLMISLNSPAFLSFNQSCPTETEIQPTLALSLIFPWLDLFPNPSLLLGFHDLIHAMNQFQLGKRKIVDESKT